MDPASEALANDLLQQGVDGKLLWKKFQVRLWNIRQRDGKVVLKVDTAANPKLSIKALGRFFEDALKQPVEIKDTPLQKCCEKNCRGCLADRPEKHADWRLDKTV